MVSLLLASLVIGAFIVRRAMVVEQEVRPERYNCSMMLTNAAVGFTLGIPGFAGLWDNLALGMFGAMFGGDRCLSSFRRNVVNGTNTFLRRFNRTRQTFTK